MRFESHKIETIFERARQKNEQTLETEKENIK